MIRVNLLDSKVEPTAFPDRFILPLYRQTRRAAFMVLMLSKTYGTTRYSLKKVLVFAKEN